MPKFTDSLYPALFNAIPIPVFIVDGDIKIQDMNEAAGKTFFVQKKDVLNLRGGEALKCLNSFNDRGGCGRGPLCKMCVIRNIVTEAMKGQGATRRHTRVRLEGDEGFREYELLVTASQLVYGDETLVILIIEDISEFSALKNILPICSRCKKIRDDSQYWHTVEEYLTKYTGVDFSHGICPDCARALYPEFLDEKNDKG